MEMTYLYYIAVIGTSYVSFTSFFLALRQIIGSTIDRSAGWMTRYLIAGALCITTTALMPPLMTLFPVDPRTSIRISALASLILLSRLDLVYLRSRSPNLKGSMDFKLWLLFLAAVATDIFFALIACGVFPGNQFALFCSAETCELVVMFQYFTISLKRLMLEKPPVSRAVGNTPKTQEQEPCTGIDLELRRRSAARPAKPTSVATSRIPRNCL